MMMRRFVAAAVAALGFSTAVSAGPINTFAGALGTITPTGVTTSSFSAAAGGTVTSFTQSGAFNPANTPIGSTLGNMGFNLTSTTAASSTFTFSPGTLTITPSAGGGSVVFNLVNPGTLLYTTNNFIDSPDNMVLASDTSPLLDFGPIGGIWNFRPTFTASPNYTVNPGTPGSITFNGSVAGSYSADFTGRILPPGDVPEPATLGTFAVLGLAGLVARRKMKKTVA